MCLLLTASTCSSAPVGGGTLPPGSSGRTFAPGGDAGLPEVEADIGRGPDAAGPADAPNLDPEPPEVGDPEVPEPAAPEEPEPTVAEVPEPPAVIQESDEPAEPLEPDADPQLDVSEPEAPPDVEGDDERPTENEPG